MSTEEVLEDFDFLDSWEERMQLILELGEGLEAMDPADKVDEHRMTGCQSRVWIKSELEAGEPPSLHFVGDSDAKIVRGLIYIVFQAFNDKSPQAILDFDIHGYLEQLGLTRQFLPSRSNGLRSMVEFMRATAAQAQQT